MKVEFQNKVQKLVMTGVFAALLAVLSQISIPLPSGVPVTLQTFAVSLCGFVLGWKLGGLSVLVYLALGAVGVPVFAGFSGGFSAFTGVTGGFLWGFLFLVLLCGLGSHLKNPVFSVALGIAGLGACHVCGVVQFAAVSASPFLSSFFVASAPYLLKDVISVVLAYLAAKAVVFSLKKAKVVAV